MREDRQILDAFDTLARQRDAGVLVSVVEVEGSTYRRPGARCLIRGDGSTVGLISGGCLEDDVAARAEAVFESGRPATLTYDSRADDDRLFGLGLGCRGVVKLLLERVDAEHPGPLDSLRGARTHRRPVAVATWLAPESRLGERLALGGADAPAELARAGEAACRHGRSVVLDDTALGQRVLVDPLLPETRLLVLGAGPDAPPLVALGLSLGWELWCWDRRAAYAVPERFPGATVVCSEAEDAASKLPVDAFTAAVTMTHHYERDKALLAWLLSTDAFYIGALGPRARSEELAEELEAVCGAPRADTLARLHAPAGLDLGADSPEGIALAIAAEIEAAARGGSGGPLRERGGPIHGGPT